MSTLEALDALFKKGQYSEVVNLAISQVPVSSLDPHRRAVVAHALALTGALTEAEALLRGIDRLVAEETGLPVHIADDPLTAVAEGTGRVLQELQFLKRVASSSRT